MPCSDRIVGLDYRPVVLHPAGIGRYARGLVGGLSELDDQELAGFRFVLFTLFFRDYRFQVRRAPVPDHPRFLLKSRPVPGKLLRWAGRAGRPFVESLLGRVDLFHYTDYLLPPFRRPRLVSTIHDAAFLRSDSWLPPKHREWMIRWSREAVRTSRIVLTVSEASRNDLIEGLDASPNQVRVTPLAADRSFFRCVPDHEIDDLKGRLGIDGDYILYLGTLEPRKNLSRLIAAYARLRKRKLAVENLVLAGNRGWRVEAIDASLAKLPSSVRDTVLLPGYIPEEALPCLMQGAKVFAYPSLWEGFGLPVVEAFASGVPVLTSSTSSLGEVAQDAAMLIDPEDETALEEGLAQILNDEALRKELTRRGRDRARELSWEETARQTLQAYRDALV